jgi:hypothetical protein
MNRFWGDESWNKPRTLRANRELFPSSNQTTRSNRGRIPGAVELSCRLRICARTDADDESQERCHLLPIFRVAQAGREEHYHRRF